MASDRLPRTSRPREGSEGGETSMEAARHGAASDRDEDLPLSAADRAFLDYVAEMAVRLYLEQTRKQK